MEPCPIDLCELSSVVAFVPLISHGSETRIAARTWA